MKKFAFALAVAVVSLPMLAQAAGKNASTTLQVTFTVKESCTVQTAAGKQNAQPAVACQFNTPYQVSRAAAQPEAQPGANGGNNGNNGNSNNSGNNGGALQTPRADSTAQDWVVYF